MPTGPLRGEPPLSELLDDPVARAMMARDGVAADEVRALLRRRGNAPVAPPGSSHSPTRGPIRPTGAPGFGARA